MPNAESIECDLLYYIIKMLSHIASKIPYERQKISLAVLGLVDHMCIYNVYKAWDRIVFN